MIELSIADSANNMTVVQCYMQYNICYPLNGDWPMSIS